MDKHKKLSYQMCQSINTEKIVKTTNDFVNKCSIT